MAILNVHNVTGLLLILLSIVAIFWIPARRYVLYLLVLQIIIGAVVWASGLRVPPQHWILAILNGGVYAMATAFERRSRPQALVLGTLVVGTLIFAYVFYVGQHAVSASGT